MAYAILKYDLNDHDDRLSHSRAVASFDMACYIFEVLMNGRRRFSDCECADEVWEYLLEEANNHNINIDKLIE